MLSLVYNFVFIFTLQRAYPQQPVLVSREDQKSEVNRSIISLQYYPYWFKQIINKFWKKNLIIIDHSKEIHTRTWKQFRSFPIHVSSKKKKKINFNLPGLRLQIEIYKNSVFHLSASSNYFLFSTFSPVRKVFETITSTKVLKNIFPTHLSSQFYVYITHIKLH